MKLKEMLAVKFIEVIYGEFTEFSGAEERCYLAGFNKARELVAEYAQEGSYESAISVGEEEI